MCPGVEASRECVFRLQKKHIDPPVPQDAVSRRRTSSAPPASASHQSCRRTQVPATTLDRVFPICTSDATAPTLPRKASSILSWESAERATPHRRALRSPSSSCEVSSREFSLKSLTGERRHLNTPGQAVGGLFNSVFPCEKRSTLDRARPILRQKSNCFSRGEEPQPKPCRSLRKCSSQSHSRGFSFIDSAVVPSPRPNPQAFRF
jgi:hypothetical protein